MKREILFRGKLKKDSNWIYGYYVVTPENTHRIYWQPFPSATSNTWHDIIPDSVGQFTGLVDKNGVKIFEVDKIKYYQPYSKKWEEGFVKWDDLWACFGIFTKIHDEYCHESDWVKIHEIEVIGNIHDNPELL